MIKRKSHPMARTRQNDPVAERLRRLAAIAEFPPLPYLGRSKVLPSHSELVCRGQGLTAASALQDGWAGHVEVLADGRRQITHLVLPGEIIAHPRRGCSLATSTVVALTPVEVCEWRVVDRDPLDALQLALAANDAIEHCCMANQIVRIGRLSAYERIGHLLLEIRDRLSLAGSDTGNRFPLPLTQEAMADVLGLTTVHVNRTLQQLRSERQVTMSAGMVELLDPQRLTAIVDYSPLIFTASRL